MFNRYLALTLLAALAAMAGDFTVVANPSVKSGEISADDLKRIFLGAKTSLEDGSAVEPVLGQGEAHEAFLKQYIGKSDAALRNHFKSLVFTGKGSMPKSFSSDSAVAEYVAKTKGAIACVALASVPSGVKKIAVK
jgi:hypothetical protein